MDAKDLPADADVLGEPFEVLAPGFVDHTGQWRRRGHAERSPDRRGYRDDLPRARPFGTTALLPTLITDLPDVTAAAIAAGIEAGKRNVPGFAGLHLEGPYLSIARKGRA
uniref:CAZy families CE9 protein n=1 Tax=uncultured Agrobacterium sp. TaxID=157277 RepID=A0A060CKU4_9HYPH|nr:CAZy families CE9 protein [uncultured Agrobacterium sp.]